MAWSQPSSKSHRLLFWSLAILAVVMVLVVAFALRRFNGEMREGKNVFSQNIPSSSSQNTDATKIEKKELSGSISEIIGESDASEKWVVLSVTTPSAVSVSDSQKAEMKTMRYRFYLGKEIESTKTIHGGEAVTISFAGEPSEEEYVRAQWVKVVK